jgi:hypothetical protein
MTPLPSARYLRRLGDARAASLLMTFASTLRRERELIMEGKSRATRDAVGKRLRRLQARADEIGVELA